MPRMRKFILRYMLADQEETCNVSIQMWRHTLFHTAEPRIIRNVETGIEYSWLLQWSERELPVDQHATFQPVEPPRVLNIGLTLLIGDVKRALNKYLDDLERDRSLQVNYERAQPHIERQLCSF